jgi:hypothetical protein
MRANAQQAQQGFILIAVAVIGLVGTLVMASVLSSSVVLEARAVDQRLATIRAYWQVMGHFRYGFSRIRQDYLCRDSDGVCDPTSSQQDTFMLEVLTSYLDEINAHRRFTFREESTNYWIDIGTEAFVEPGTTHLHTMHLGMRNSFPGTQSTLPVLSGIAQTAARLEIKFCVHLAAWTNACGPLSSNNFGGTLNGYYRVKSLVRL